MSTSSNNIQQELREILTYLYHGDLSDHGIELQKALEQTPKVSEALEAINSLVRECIGEDEAVLNCPCAHDHRNQLRTQIKDQWFGQEGTKSND